MDFEKIYLTHAELGTLRKCKTDSVPIDQCERLIRFHLVKEEIELIPGYAGRPLGTCRITDAGRDYLVFYANDLRRLWLKNAWIPIIVSFLTTVATNYILPKLPEMFEWLGHTLSRIFS